VTEPADPRDAEEGTENEGDTDVSSEAQSRLGLAFRTVMDALDTQPEELEDVSERLFGETPDVGLEDAALDHARRSQEASLEAQTAAASGATGVSPIDAPGRRGQLEEFVRLSFRRARGEATPAETQALARLEHELGAPSVAEVEQEPVPEVDPQEFIRDWRKANPEVRPDPYVTEDGVVKIDPLDEDPDDGAENLP
jgi:hypothetical protein